MPAQILVVDDEPHLERVILQAFRKEVKGEELAFVFARSGKDALALLEEHTEIDLVLCDINMPEMNGLTLLRTLNQTYPMLQVVMVTAYGDMTNIRASMNHGAFDFLNKPIDFQDLKITIRKTLTHVDQLKELYRERQQRYLAEKLRSVTETLTATLEMEEVLDRFLQNMTQVVPFETAFVCLYKAGSLQLVSATGKGEDEEPQTVLPYLRGLYAKVSKNRHPLLIEALGGFDGNGKGFPSTSGALLCLPLISKHGVPGMVVLASGHGKTFHDHERDIAFSLAGQASFAIENARLFEEVRRLATTDSLTQLHSRRHFLELAEQEIQRAKRYNHSMCMIMADIDHFKRFNDTYGHVVGDMVLKHVAATLTRECRQTDVLGRFGGDEMAIMLIETDAALGREIAERLRSGVERHPIQFRKKDDIGITISIGLAALDPEKHDLDRLLHLADRQLYIAKERGRNRVELAQQEGEKK